MSTAGALAQELLTTDEGISFRGTVRLLQANAAICNVIAKNEQGNYEAMRVNQDQPLHLWELEFSVFNGSGRALDHLIAYYDIASPWPPCTNWTEQYEGLGHYEWTDPSGRIQQTGAATPTLPNQTHTETIPVLAFDGVRPQFTDWSVNYTFLGGGTATAAGEPNLPNPAGSVSVRDSPPINEGQDVFFGDDTSDWANDGECDDPRFEGPGTADTLLDEDMFRDATDCRTLLDRGQIPLAEYAPATGAPRTDGKRIRLSGRRVGVYAPAANRYRHGSFIVESQRNHAVRRDALYDHNECWRGVDNDRVGDAGCGFGLDHVQAGSSSEHRWRRAHQKSGSPYGGLSFISIGGRAVLR